MLHHRSRSAVSCERILNERTGDCPSGGLPRLFRITGIGFSMQPYYEKTGPRGIPAVIKYSSYENLFRAAKVPEARSGEAL